MNRVMQSATATGLARLVLLVIANHSGGDEGVAFPSIERIAIECGITPRAVRTNIRKLEAAGELVSLGIQPGFDTTMYAVLPGMLRRVAATEKAGRGA